MTLLRAPRLTEKSSMIGDSYHQVVFKVAPDATKPEIKQAVELMFAVKVENVRVSNVSGKRKITRNIPGRRPGWKKAYVKLKPGFDIDFMGDLKGV